MTMTTTTNEPEHLLQQASGVNSNPVRQEGETVMSHSTETSSGAPHWARTSTTYNGMPSWGTQHHSATTGIPTSAGILNVQAYQFNEEAIRITAEVEDELFNLDLMEAHRLAAVIKHLVAAINDPQMSITPSTEGLGDYENVVGGLDRDVASALDELVAEMRDHNVQPHAVYTSLRRILGRIERGEG